VLVGDQVGSFVAVVSIGDSDKLAVGVHVGEFVEVADDHSMEGDSEDSDFRVPVLVGDQVGSFVAVASTGERDKLAVGVHVGEFVEVADDNSMEGDSDNSDF